MIEQFLGYLKKEWSVVSQTPFSFLVLASLMLSIAFLAIRWRYASISDQLRACIETLNERLRLKSEQMELYKERALKYNEKAQEVVDSDSVRLKEKTLELVRNIRNFIEKYKREDQTIHETDWVEMIQAKTEKEKQKLWSKFTSTLSRLSDRRNSEYDCRFKVDSIILRDELWSRLSDYKAKIHSDDVYEHLTNYFGFTDAADDLERMAKMLANNANKRKVDKS